MPEDAPRERLPRTVRVGYGMGSVATGAFGTVPGLLLLPYLTDTLGIAAAAAGAIVFLPKAWDVLLNPVAGRISDRHVSAAGPRRPFLLRAGAALAVCFALLFAGPDLGSPAADATYVVAAFLACATAYAFFQVPFVAMPAEITDSYDERTRLLSWRVALLALAILVSGAPSPAIRDAIGGRDGYRAMGLFVAALILVGTFGAYFGTRRAPVGTVVAAGGSLAAQLRVVAASRDFRMLLATFVVQALAVGPCSPASTTCRGRSWTDPAPRRSCSSASSVRRCCSRRCGPCSGPTQARSAGTCWHRCSSREVRSCSSGRRCSPSSWCTWRRGSSVSGTPGRRCSRCRCCPTPPPWTPPARARTARASSPVSGRPVRPSAWPSVPGCSPLVLALGGYVSSTGADATQPASALTAITLGFSLMPAVLTLLSLVWLSRYSLTAEDVAAATTERSPRV